MGERGWQKLLKMSEPQKHGYRWDHTENALTFWSMFVTKNIGNHRERIYDLFLERPCFATEKYDGTNIAKDDGGQIYSRRLLIGEEQEEFMETNLKKVKEANVLELRNKFLECAELDTSNIIKFVSYGEFLCNKYYDYMTRSVVGDWKVFGAIIEVKQKPEESLEKMLKAGFAACIKSSNKHHIQILLNEKFVEVVKSVDIDVPDYKGNNESVSEVIAKNKDDMKKGKIEGLIFTIYDFEFGYKVVKWKGAQEYQPIANEKAEEANVLVQKEDVKEELKTVFASVAEIITDLSENKKAQQKAKKSKKIQDKEKQPRLTAGKKYMTNKDKELIQDGIIHSQKNFDTLQIYEKRGEIDDYNENLVKEVAKHLAEENPNFEDMDENILSFIRHKVKAVVKSQLAGDGKFDKTGN